MLVLQKQLISEMLSKMDFDHSIVLQNFQLSVPPKLSSLNQVSTLKNQKSKFIFYVIFLTMSFSEQWIL